MTKFTDLKKFRFYLAQSCSRHSCWKIPATPVSRVPVIVMWPVLLHRSTDSQLKLWSLKKPQCLRTFKGHINEKNFVGLATDGDYIACGLFSGLPISFISFGYLDILPGNFSPLISYTIGAYVVWNNCHKSNFYVSTALLSSIQLSFEQTTCFIKMCRLQYIQFRLMAQKHPSWHRLNWGLHEKKVK